MQLASRRKPMRILWHEEESQMHISTTDREGLEIVQRMLADSDAAIDRHAMANALEAIIARISTDRMNVNAEVALRLTPAGRDILDRHHADIRKALPESQVESRMGEETTDEQGRTRLLLWRAMQVFGPHMRQAAPLPFDATIEIVDSRL